MITYAAARRWIEERGVWDELARLQGFPTVEAAKQATDEFVVWSAFGKWSVASESLRAKLHPFPIPDIDSAGRYSDSSLQYHLGSGLKDARGVATFLQQFGDVGSRKQRILDFGCGLGRLLRYMVQFAPQHDYVASEVNPRAVEWLRSVYKQVNVLQADPAPPLPLADASIDAAYAFSIFTHFSEPLHQRWLAELARVIRPGGLLIVTIHGQAILDLMAQDEQVAIIMRSWQANLPELRKGYNDSGFAFYYSYPEADAADFGVDGQQFGMAFISPDYLLRNWTRYFDLVWFDPGAVAKWQDYVILRRKPREQCEWAGLAL